MDKSRRRELLLVAGVLALLAVLAYLRPLLLGDTFVLRDHLIMGVPARTHLAAAVRAGHLPQWWSAVGLGAPYAANPAHAVFYPPTWLAAILPPAYACDLLYILHVLLGGLGVAALSRRLGARPLGAIVAGGAFMTSGYVATLASSGLPVMTLAWTPWVVWAADRLGEAEGGRLRARRALAVAALLALQVLSGDPAGLVTSGLVSLLFVLARARRRLVTLAVLAASAVVAVSLAAISIAPALALLGESTRAGGVPLDAAAVWSMHPLRALEWVWPGALGDPAIVGPRAAHLVADTGRRAGLAPGWAASEHIGAAVLFLAVLAGVRRGSGTRVLLLGSAAFVLLALGTFTPVYVLFRTVMPFERIVRYPERHIAGALVLWCVLSGVGFTQAFQGPRPRRALLWAVVASCSLALIVAVATLVRSTLLARLGTRAAGLGLSFDVGGTIDFALGSGRIAVVAFALVPLLLVLRSSPALARFATVTAAVAILAPLVGHALSSVPLAPRSVLANPPEILGPVLADVRPPAPRPRVYRPLSLPGRVDTPTAYATALVGSAFQNLGTIWGIAYYPGYDSSQTRRFRNFLAAAIASAPAERVLTILGVRWAILPGAEAEATTLPIRARGPGGWALLEWATARPRAFVAARWRRVASDEETEKLLFAPQSDMGEVRLVGEPSSGGIAGQDPVPCAVAEPWPERVVLDCDSPAGGHAVLLDAWAPGWSATVDGQPATVERAEVLVRAVAIPPGAHRVVFSYRTPGLRAGAAVSLGGWLGLAILALWLRRRQRLLLLRDHDQEATEASEEGRVR